VEEITEGEGKTCSTSVKSGQAEGLRSRDYGSGKRNLLYFRKFRFGVRRIECGLRKWEEILAILP
jgi:hypothetical protein